MTRNRILFGAAALALAVPANGALAGPAPRVEEAPYVAGTVQGLNFHANQAGSSFGGVLLPGGLERYVSVTATDDSGLPVSIAVTQDTDGDGTPELRKEVCGSTSAPLKITPNADLIVYLFQGPCGGGPAAATSGVVTATFQGRAK